MSAHDQQLAEQERAAWTAWSKQNAAIARLIGGRVRERGFSLGGCSVVRLFDHPAYIWKEHRGIAILSHSYISPAMPHYELGDGVVARRLRVESGWNSDGCRVYVLMARNAPEWDALAEEVG